MEGRGKQLLKSIGFIGYECEDIILHLAKLLSYQGKKVTIIDRSEQAAIFGIVGMLLEHKEMEEQIPEYYLGELKITSNQTEADLDSDVLLFYFGYQLDECRREQCDGVFLVTDEVLFHARLLNKAKDICEKRWLLVRNGIDLKYDISYLEQIVGDLSVTSLYVPFCEIDWKRRCYLSIDRSYHIEELSSGMKNALVEMLSLLQLQFTKAEIKRAIKKA